MKKIEDYFGTKTVIKCDNEQQWNKLKELCGDKLEFNSEFNSSYPLFSLYLIGFDEKNTVHQILTYSDFVSDVPELVGVEMEVSHTERTWYKMIVYGYSDCGYLTEKGTYKYARPIERKVLTATLLELAEKLGVDEIIIK